MKSTWVTKMNMKILCYFQINTGVCKFLVEIWRLYGKKTDEMCSVIVWLFQYHSFVGLCCRHTSETHDDVMKWKHFPHYWPFVQGIHQSPVNSAPKGQWRGALMFSLICFGINGWVNNRKAGDLRRHHAHYDVIIMPVGGGMQYRKSVLILNSVSCDISFIDIIHFSCPIIFKFNTVSRILKFSGNWKKVMGKQDFVRFESKLCFGRITYTAQGPRLWWGRSLFRKVSYIAQGPRLWWCRSLFRKEILYCGKLTAACHPFVGLSWSSPVNLTGLTGAICHNLGVRSQGICDAGSFVAYFTIWIDRE